MNVNWSDPECPISVYFKVKEAIYLPSWKRLANATDGLNDEVKNNLLKLFNGPMDELRDILGPIIVHVSYRPDAYNKAIGGALNSAHTLGMACDFHCTNHSINETKDLILQKDLLNQLNLRMEKGTNTWVHIDIKPLPSGGNRYFNP